jgi:hypothetical protein
MITRILHPVTRRELYAFSSAIPTAKRITPTSVGLYGPDGTFKAMMDALRKDQRLKDAGGFVICTEMVQHTPLGPVVRKTFAKYDL